MTLFHLQQHFDTAVTQEGDAATWLQYLRWKSHSQLQSPWTARHPLCFLDCIINLFVIGNHVLEILQSMTYWARSFSRKKMKKKCNSLVNQHINQHTSTKIPGSFAYLGILAATPCHTMPHRLRLSDDPAEFRRAVRLALSGGEVLNVGYDRVLNVKARLKTILGGLMAV